MNVLVVYSNPPGSDSVRLDREERVFFRLRRDFPDVCIDRLHASEVDDIHEAINAKPYDVIQFTGHNSSHGLYLSKGDIYEDEVVSPQRLGSLLQLAAKDPRVVMLLNCYSSALQSALSPLAPFVITSRDNVPTGACTAFVKGFFQSLFKNQSVQLSFEYAKKFVNSAGYSADGFDLARRHLIEHGGSVFVESKPDPSRDSILVNLDAVIGRLEDLNLTQEEFSFLLARKLRIHSWIFEIPRDGALIPIGRHLFGEFKWENAADVVYCKRIMRLSPDVPQEHWQLWVKLLLAYNDLASSPYRGVMEHGLVFTQGSLEQAVKLFKVSVFKHILPLREAHRFAFFADLIPHVEFVIASVEQAEDQLALGRMTQVVVALETALTNFHELLGVAQPPEETRSKRDAAS